MRFRLREMNPTLIQGNPVRLVLEVIDDRNVVHPFAVTHEDLADLRGLLYLAAGGERLPLRSGEFPVQQPRFTPRGRLQG